MAFSFVAVGAIFSTCLGQYHVGLEGTMRTVVMMILACTLAGCQTDGDHLGDRLGTIAGALDPSIKVRRDYDKSVTAYRSCIAANPVTACEGERQIMLANQRVLSADLSRPRTDNSAAVIQALNPPMPAHRCRNRRRAVGR